MTSANNVILSKSCLPDTLNEIMKLILLPFVFVSTVFGEYEKVGQVYYWKEEDNNSFLHNKEKEVKMGDLTSLMHGVKGEVYVIRDISLKIKNFTFQGNFTCIFDFNYLSY